jgi:thiopeptide-type bacteriocin biosynthesis protein
MTFEFLSELILRAPLLSYEDYHPDSLDELIQQEWFKLAIYLASPEFYARLAINNFSGGLLTNKERVTLLKYYNRMSFRPTPFGTFSSFSTLGWGEGLTQVQLSKPNEARLKLFVDQYAAAKLSTTLPGENSGEHLFFSNPTLYKTNKEFRYIKTITDPDSGKASYLLESFDATGFTKSLLFFLGKQHENYTNTINYIKTNTECDETEATEYLSFLIEEQIVLSRQGISILGEDHLNRLVNVDAFKSKPKTALKGLLKRMNGIGYPNLSDVEVLAKELSDLLIKSGAAPPKQLFYANLERPVCGTVDIAYQQQLREALHCMQYLSPQVQSKTLADFIRQFKARFDLQKVPLLQALDPETGIAYGSSGASISANPLLQDMYIDQNKAEVDSVQWSAAHRLLFEKWNTSAHPRKEIMIAEHDLDSLKKPPPTLPLPPSIPVMFRLYDETIVIEATGGASATALIGRFTLLSKDVKTIADKVAEHEQQTNPDVIFAEINQLSDNHIDNINRRLPVYDYELTINAPYTLDKDKQVHLDDLVLSVVKDELIMESVAMKKRVIPRLSTAYNYQNHQLSLFHFLGDLQQHSIRSNFTVDLEIMFPGMPFYPRVTYRQTILCLAKWHLYETDIKQLAQGSEAVKKIRTERLWPRYIALGGSDQQLVFDLDNEAETGLFLDCIRTESHVKITEHLMPYTSKVINHGGKPVVNQFIAIILSKNAAYKYSALQLPAPKTQAVREFITGSKWIYFKIYCAPSRANDLLVKKILPVLRSSKQNGVQGWFFIRFIDTAPHIRLRIKVKEEFLGEVLIALKAKLAIDVRYQLIQEYKADVYRRELERYGADIMEDVEKVFEKSSDLIINYLKQASSPAFNFAYHSLAFVTVAEIVALFFPDIATQISFTQQVAHSFSVEHQDVKALKFTLDKKYRSLKEEISQLIDDKEGYYKKLKLTRPNTQLKESVFRIIDLAESFTTERKIQLAADLLHMHLNRLFADEQRYQELVVYHCLHKHLQAVLARSLKEKK